MKRLLRPAETLLDLHGPEPTPTLDGLVLSATSLPVEACLPDLRAALADEGAAVLVAPPGSGKTTLVPLRLLDEPWLQAKIVMLEPRRIATRAAARRMAALLGEEVGETVGYVTRDDRQTGPGTRIEVVTEGVLTRRLQRSPELADTGLVIFDELHERNLQTDLGLALALSARARGRHDLRLLAMSATIDAARVARLLGGGEPAAVIESPARYHPVELRWAPLPRGQRIEPHVAALVRHTLVAEQGSVLVFLPGVGEINRVLGLLDGVSDVALLPLHGTLPATDQDRALQPSPGRRVVVATDIAESSLTVEGVRVVIDGGLARAPRFDPRTGMTRLRTVPISKASADQRAGRAGRDQPGVAYRAWSQIEHSARTPHTPPEITEVDLAGLALELAIWGDEDLVFLDPPPRRALAEARGLLTDLGALDETGRPTDKGRRMTGLPLHPRLARMVVDAGVDAGLACRLAALLDERDILRGEEIPVDLRARLEVLEGGGHRAADRRAAERARRVVTDLERRARVSSTEAIDLDQAGAVLGLAFPDRLAVRRGGVGQFQLRTGTTAWVPDSDPLATEAYLVAADLDGKRKDARIRLAAALDAEQVATAFAHEVEESVRLAWVGDRLVERHERRLGGLALDTLERRPGPGPATVAALLKRIADRRLVDLPWTPAAGSLRQRVEFLRGRFGEPWPDWSDGALAKSLAEWLGPALNEATGLDQVGKLDLLRILRRRLGGLAAELDRLAPPHIELPSGRRAGIDYSSGRPVLAARAQDLYGLSETPPVADQPVTVQVLSPAGRPIQVTSDLAGFWAGSWREVRKEMAARYPKHHWPEHPG